MKKEIKKLFVLALGIMMVFALAACGGGSSDSGEAAEGGEEAQVLKVVTEATFAPFEFTEDGNEEIVGFDVDMMNAIAESQGLQIEFVNMEFDSLIPALQSDQGDIICAGMNKLTGIDSVTPDMKLASQIGTTGGDMVQAMKDEGKIADAIVLNQWTDCYMQLQNGDVQGVIVDMPVGEAYLNNHSDIAKFVGDKFGDHEEFAFAVKKGNTELLDKLNAGLAELKENGTYDELVAKWFN